MAIILHIGSQGVVIVMTGMSNFRELSGYDINARHFDIEHMFEVTVLEDEVQYL